MAPQFFSCRRRRLLWEVEINENLQMRAEQEVMSLMEKLSETVRFKRWELHVDGGTVDGSCHTLLQHL